MRILVTGATGFVGANLVRCLIQQGHQVIGFDLAAPDQRVWRHMGALASQATFIQGDVRDTKAVRSLGTQGPIDSIVHAVAATVVTPEEERARGREALETNLLGTINLLELGQQAQVRRFLYVSSVAVYGAAPDSRGTVQETDPMNPTGYYDITKLASELITRRYAEIWGLNVVVARINGPYGPMERPTSSRLGMSIIYQLAQLAETQRRVKVAGYGVARDWTYVADTAQGITHLLFGDSLHEQTYNVSSGVLYSLKEIVENLATLLPETEFVEVRPEDGPDVVMNLSNKRLPLNIPLDISRLNRDTGFRLAYDLFSGLKAYVEWRREEKMGH